MRIRTPHDVATLARGRRLEVGLTQAELARRVGVSRKWVSEFETGKVRVDLGTVLRVFDVLGVGLEAGSSDHPRPAGEAIDLDRVLADYLRRP